MIQALPRLLCVDTSTEVLALCVVGPEGSRALLAPGGAQASATLLPQAQSLLAQVGWSLRDLTAIAFGCGPGAFTGLRTSCAVAQGLGLGLGLPLLAIDSLLIVAEDARWQTGGLEDFEVEVAVDARMDEAYTARYARAAGRWQTMEQPRLVPMAALATAGDRRARPAAWQAGSAWPLLEGRGVVAPGSCRCPPEADRASALGRLAAAAWADGAAVDPACALPLYLRDKVALTSAERAAQVPR